MPIRRLLPALAAADRSQLGFRAHHRSPRHAATMTSSGDSAQIQSAITYAITQFDNEFSDNITLHINIVAGNVQLGQSQYGLTDASPSAGNTPTSKIFSSPIPKATLTQPPSPISPSPIPPAVRTSGWSSRKPRLSASFPPTATPTARSPSTLPTAIPTIRRTARSPAHSISSV